MKRFSILGAAILSLALAACGGTETKTVTETEYVYDTITLTETVTETETEYVYDTITQTETMIQIQTETVGTAGDPMLKITGDYSLMEGETLTLTVETIDGEDATYSWMSSDDMIATVEDGVVTGVAAGEVLITATGDDTGAEAIHGVVVLAEGVTTPFLDLWMASGHGDTGSEAFQHWAEDDPPVVSTSCAKCHSTTGFLDFLGEDGSDFGTVEATAPGGEGITCGACHNATASNLDSVTFPSGMTVTGLGSEARCMQCHQGRNSTPQVDAAITAAGVGDDEVSADLGFKNVHYFAAGATLFGAEAQGGYQYSDMVDEAPVMRYYTKRFGHEMGVDSCKNCHDVHATTVKTEGCAACHAGEVDDFRMPGSMADYDGDGDMAEGVRAELEGMNTALYAAIQAYALATEGVNAIIYDSHSYPYFFVDTDEDGEADEDEVNYGNSFKTWTPRLLRACYNYQYAQKDPGAFAHNANYVAQILYDSIMDVGGDVSAMARNDHGHFDGDGEAFRHWDGPDDGNGFVSASCNRCHTSDGAKFFFETGLNPASAMPASDGLTCNVCHTGTDYADGAPRRFVAEIEFPSGFVAENDSENPDDSFLCMNCHQGRQSMASLEEAIVNGAPGFKNVHYLPAGAMIYGSAAMVGFQYDGKDYAGQWSHYGGTSASCTACHTATGMDHSFAPALTAGCMGCHSEATEGDLHTIRKNRTTDYDGDGDNTEPLNDEIMALADALYAQIQAWALAEADVDALIYFPGAYPYFFKDTNENGDVDPGEAIYPNKYSTWTEELMIAAHHYQISQKEHGAWAHNTDYMAQLLIDSIEDLGGDVSGLNRP